MPTAQYVRPNTTIKVSSTAISVWSNAASGTLAVSVAAGEYAIIHIMMSSATGITQTVNGQFTPGMYPVVGTMQGPIYLGAGDTYAVAWSGGGGGNGNQIWGVRFVNHTP